jgi:hypothetical protein
MKLLLVATHASNGCCRIFTMNPGQADARVICTAVALDPDERVVYSWRIPGNTLSRHRRFIGFGAPPGRHGHGVFQLTIDLRSRLVHRPVPTRSLARRHTDLTRNVSSRIDAPGAPAARRAGRVVDRSD